MPDALRLIGAAGGLSRGRLPAFTSLGGYPLIYLDREGEVLCAGCATTEYFDWLYAIPAGLQWQYEPAPRLVDVHWEGPDEICAGCNQPVPSAYGDPDATLSGQAQP